MPRPDRSKIRLHVSTTGFEIRWSYDLLHPVGVMRPEDTYVELGAWHGNFLRQSGLLRSRCRYVLAEPSPDAHQELRRVFHNAPHVKVVQCAVADKDGHLAFRMLDDGRGDSLYRADGEKRMVQTYCLKTFFRRNQIRRVRLLAVNCECAEYGILTRDNPALDCVDWITCEFHAGKSGIRTRQFVRKHLAKRFETVATARHARPYNLWLGRRRDAIQ